MKEGPDISHIAALIGDPARANILTALMDGRALTASELAEEAGVGLSTASGHLSKLAEAELIAPRKSGRHKYFNLADAEVAGVLESLMGLAARRGTTRVRTGPRDAQMQVARVCYNHLAGQLGVQMYSKLLAQGVLMEDGEDVALTASGRDFMTAFGIDLDALEKGRTRLCRSCLDWSERRTHLAGSLGRAMLTCMEQKGWMSRETGSRAIHVTKAGQVAFADMFGVD
ncbi:ArsR family transcriptional regulator [Tateyamaria omphalii]|uniref:ArsR/SmtB family transcription factor n=1 Tax=Tateyamaria omphalii TaxID=299262 RepID=UPI0016724830|nr:winged helix-turn-helix domain-containing protein [Tateyamaria omphalii]GGX54955.1 ArsR family transcriptional regulator [Tateyamaria omphalii]